MKEKYCSRCKTKEGTFIKYSKTVSKIAVHQYYYCNPCNTARMQDYTSTAVGKSNLRKAVYKSIAKLKWKQDARIKVRDAIRAGKMSRPETCQSCNKKCKPHGHHDDYTKPLEVRWLCVTCHALVHSTGA